MIRGIVLSVIEGVIKRFTASGRTGEIITNREYFQHYGFTSRPLAGAECIIIREGNHIVMIASDDRRYRIALESGEVALYTDEGDKIQLKRGGNIEISAGAEVTVIAPSVKLADAEGVKKLVHEEFIPLYNDHKHSPTGSVPIEPAGAEHMTAKTRAT